MHSTIRERIDDNFRAVVSSIWIFVLLNILFRDVHEIVRPGAIEEYMASSVSELTFLASGVALTLFISMVVLTRVLPYQSARWTNLTVPLIALLGMFTSAPRDLDDIWFLIVEAIGLLAVIWLAWNWRIEDSAGSEAETVPVN